VGRTARGVKGIRLGKGDKVVAMEKVEEDYTFTGGIREWLREEDRFRSIPRSEKEGAEELLP